jgi:excisionase family DNA binding protein
MNTKTNENIRTARLLIARDAAGYLAISERKLWAMSKAKTIPVVRLGRAVRYDRQDLDAFIQQAKMGAIQQVMK